MKMYLDYERLTRTDVRAAVYQFLVTVCGNDEEREAVAAYPKFFSLEPGTLFVSIHLSALQRRAEEVRRYCDDGEEVLRSTCEWLGIDFLEYAGTVNDTHGLLRLPPDFPLNRDESYDGLTSEDPWLISAKNKDGEEIEVLVLDVQIVEEKDRGLMNGTHFFLIGVPFGMINTGKAPIDQTDEERFD